MKNTNPGGLWTASYGEIGATLRALQDQGVTCDHLKRIRAEPGYAKRVAEFMIRGGLESSVHHTLAREIMGKNMFGVEEAIQYFGVNPTSQQFDVLSEVPFSKTVLEQSKNTHVLVAVFPLSIIEIREKVDSKLFYHRSWWNKESFAKEHDETSWQLLRKTPVGDSTWKNWEEQQTLTGEDDEVPTAQVMVYTIIGHYLATDERLFKRIYVRTCSVDSGGGRASVGFFDPGRLFVCGWQDFYRGVHVGVSSARKP